MGNIQPSLGKLTLVYPGASWGSFTTESSGSKGNGWCFLNPPPAPIRRVGSLKFLPNCQKEVDDASWSPWVKEGKGFELWTLSVANLSTVLSCIIFGFQEIWLQWGEAPAHCLLELEEPIPVSEEEREREYLTAPCLLAAHDDNTPGSSRVKGTMHCNSPIITHLIILYGGTLFFLMLSHKNLLLHTGVSYALCNSSWVLVNEIVILGVRCTMIGS